MLLSEQDKNDKLPGGFDMDKIAALVSLNEAKQTIDELISKVKNSMRDNETETRRVLIIILSVLGALTLIGVIAYIVYRNIGDFADDYDDIDDLFDDDEEPEVLVSDEDYE